MGWMFLVSTKPFPVLWIKKSGLHEQNGEFSWFAAWLEG